MIPQVGELYRPRDDDTIVAETDDYSGGGVVVFRHGNGLYTVVNNGIARHVNGDAEMAMRALAAYLQGYMWSA